MKSSATQNLLVVALTVLAIGLAGSGQCLAWSLASQPIEGVVLLKNSNVLRGKVQKQGKHYFVYLPNGQLRIPEKQVETVCEDLQAAYEYRKAKHSGSSIDSHLDLVGWCLRHELLKQAEQELTAAESIDKAHPRLGLLNRQLTQSLKMVEHQKQLQLAATQVVPEPEPIDPATLEKAPKWARALFVRQIQPLMVQSCATSGCHQSTTESEFQLSRLAIDGVGHPGVTLRNLAQTLEQIDWQSAEHSNLLARAKQAHGGDEASEPLPPHKLKVLQAWVEQLAEAQRQENQRQENQLQALPAVTEIAQAPITPTLELNGPELTDPIAIEPNSTEGVRMASYQPKDPFDPAVFNDRYAAAKPAPALPIAQQAPLPGTLVPDASVPHVSAPPSPEDSSPEDASPQESQQPIPLPATE